MCTTSIVIYYKHISLGPPKIINFYLSQTIAKRMREGGWMYVQWFFLDMRAATIRKLYGRLYSSSGVYA